MIDCINHNEKNITIPKGEDPLNHYFCDNLMNWTPYEKVDIVHSMEVLYYLQNPQKLIEHIYKNWLKENARLIIGIDFYSENTVSHSWPEDCGISIMQLFPESTWKKFFIESGFRNIESWRVGAKKDWTGTLVVTGIK